MTVQYRVELNDAEQEQLQALLRGGRPPVRRAKRAQVLLAAQAGASDDTIAISVGVSLSTVYRVRRRFVFPHIVEPLRPLKLPIRRNCNRSVPRPAAVTSGYNSRSAGAAGDVQTGGEWPIFGSDGKDPAPSGRR